MTFADCRLLLRLTGDMPEGISKDGTGGGKKESFISVLADHYPQTLGSCIMLRPPSYVFQVWRGVRAVMDPKTAKAYYFLRTPREIEESLDTLFPAQTSAWIRKETGLVQAETTKAAVEAGKTFRGPDFWGIDSGSGHDSRGAAEYVRRYCIPVEQRAPRDRFHRCHPNIQHLIETGTTGVEGGAAAAMAALEEDDDEAPFGETAGAVGGAVAKAKKKKAPTPKQEREDARKIIAMTMRKIKLAVDDSEKQKRPREQ